MFAIFLTGYFFVVSGNICTLLSSGDGEVIDSQPMSDLYCEQEEADTKILFHCQYISRHNSSVPIIVRSPDADVFILLLGFSGQFESMLFLYWDRKQKKILKHFKII